MGCTLDNNPAAVAAAAAAAAAAAVAKYILQALLALPPRRNCARRYLRLIKTSLDLGPPLLPIQSIWRAGMSRVRRHV